MSLVRVLMLTVLGGVVSFASGASQDGHVEWAGLSHVGWQDRTPRVPVGGEGFAVRFQAYADDLTAARVVWDDGSAQSADAAIVSTRGPYAIWEATIPGTGSGRLEYVFEVIDGDDVDYLGAGGASETVPGSWFVVDFDTLEHAPAGATPVTGGVVFKVWSPSRPSCHVRGEFNGWGTGDPMMRVGDHFVAFVLGAQAGQMYKYFFSGSLWKPDARARLFVPTDNYNSVVVDPDGYEWQVVDFSPAPLEQTVIYQLHVGTFAGRNDPAGPTPNPSRYVDVAARVDHLAELGVNAVMLNPMFEFPGDFSGGYNPITAWAVESKLGSVAEFQAMVDALHGRGIAVLVDIVWNHFSPSDNYLWNYDGTQIYFDSPAVDTPWGAQADLDNPRVREYFLDSAHAFLHDYRIDGYRVDAVMSMVDSGWTPQWGAGQTLMRGLNDLVDNRHGDKHVIAEKYDDDSWTVGDSSWGLGFDAQYHNAFKNNLRSAVFAEAAGGNPNMGWLASSIGGTGGSVGTRAMNYFELHDDAWPMNGHQRAVRQFDPAPPSNNDLARGLQTLANGVALTARGVPAILQGTEWLEDDGWEVSRLNWARKTLNAGVFAFYRDLIGLRTSKPALSATSPVHVFHVNEGSDVLAFNRWGPDGRSYVVVVNISPAPFNSYLLGMPRAGEWGVIINNDAAEYDGSGFGTAGVFTTEPIARDGFAQRAALSIPAYGFMLLQHEPEFSGCNAADLAAPFGILDLADVTAFVAAFGSQSPLADLNGDGVWDLADITAFVAAFSGGCP